MPRIQPNSNSPTPHHFRALCVAATAAAAIAVILPGGASAKGRTGTIAGVVTYSGTAKDAFCAKHPSKDESLVVKGGKVAGVHVGIKNGQAGSHSAPSSPVVVTQKGCVYQPRMNGIMGGQKLEVRNGDKTMHNVHAFVGRETWFNRGQKPASPAIVEQGSDAGSVMELKCDVHPWMRAYAVVTDHPFFDVTNSGGSFTIKNVPEGTYTLIGWHPELKKKRKKITVTAGQTTTVELKMKKK